MYEAILAQPQAYVQVAQACAPGAASLATIRDSVGHTHLVGTGSSHHAALFGAHLFRVAGGRAEAATAFDFTLWGPPLRERDTVVVVSHRGTKRYSLAALERAQAAGCRTVLICGRDAPAPAVPPDVLLPTVPQEPTSAHTLSCTSAIAALQALAGAGLVGGGGEGLLPPAEVAAGLREALLQEAAAKEAAVRHARRRRVWLFGAGAGAVTALEAALKIKETSYLPAEGMSAEALLHGPFQCAEAEDLFVAVGTAGPGAERVAALAAMAGDIGAPCLWVGAVPPPAGCEHIPVPQAPEPFAALLALVPLQLLAYHLALVRGTDPDGFRLEDPRFARAAARARL